VKTIFNQENLNSIDKLMIGGIDMWGNMLATQQLLELKYEKVLGIDMDNMKDEQLMSLRDEVMEYAKTTRCFKYWSKSDPDPFVIRLEEFVDGVHLYLQQFLYYGLTPQEIVNIMEKVDLHVADNRRHIEKNKNMVINTFLSNAMDWLITPDPVNNKYEEKLFYIKSFGCFMTAGRADGFTDEDIEKGYYLKNRINQERLKSGY
jgi:dimeric dUTPase (all-alpha-NTP-PPase superfamily)